MKQIFKNKEPNSLIEHRAKGGNFNDLKKDELRECLLNEQGYICCYCMKRIPQKLKPEEIEKHTPDCKIEHFKCQSGNPDLTLNYQNLLISCNGYQGYPQKMQTCDTYKGERNLTYNPASTIRNVENILKYKSNGEIYSDDSLLNSELIDILNLNTKDLRDIRAIYYKDIQERIIIEGKKQGKKNIQKKFLESEKKRLLTKSVKEKFLEYCMVGVYLINKKLSKLN